MRNNTIHSKQLYPYDEWNIIEDKFEVAHNYQNETVFALGNGYLGMRGNFEEGNPGEPETGLDGTYINGFYETETIKYPEIAYGYPEKSQTMLNVTNFKIIKLFLDDEEFNMLTGETTDYQRVLSFKEGILRRSLVWCSPKGKKVQISIERLISFRNPHLAAIRYQVTPLNFNGKIKLSSIMDGNVSNITTETDPRVGSGIHGKVLYVKETKNDENFGLIIQYTQNSKLTLACAMHNQIDTKTIYSVNSVANDTSVRSDFMIDAEMGSNIILTKYIAVVTTLDCLESEISAKAIHEATQAKEIGFQNIKNEQKQFLAEFWDKADVMIKGDPTLQQGIRFNIYHLLQSVGRDGKSNIAAKGLTGEGYEGHYFWDTETYILPFFLYNHPEISRKLLEYRYHTLDQARERARQMSHPKGALFPWRTINGEECSTFFPAGTAQYHINADIAFSIKKYIEATEDWDFLVKFGAEILFETARLWVDLGNFNPSKNNQFCINAVTGPDEYTAIVNNNCYTNLMAKENLEYAVKIAFWMKESAINDFQKLQTAIELTDAEIDFWKRIADNMYIPYEPGRQIHLQDDNFLDRKPWDFAHTPPENYPLLMHYHPLVIYRHQVCKQADLVLALFLLSQKFTLAQKKRDFDFYEKITTHDSSLSTCIFSIVANEVGYREKAYHYFMGTARMDLDNTHGNTKDGIHAANMAGTWMSLVNGFAGMRVDDDLLSFQPYLPDGWEEYSFKIIYRKRLIEITVNSNGATYKLLEGECLQIFHDQKPILLNVGKAITRK